MHLSNLIIILILNVKSAKKEREVKIKQKNSSSNPISGKIIAILLTVAILIIGSFFYFASSKSNGMVVSNSKDMDSDVPQEQIDINVPQEQIDSDVPQEQIDINVPQEQIDINVPQEQIDTNVPQEQIDINVPQEQIDINVPQEQIDINVPQEQMSTNYNPNTAENNYKYTIVGVQENNVYIKTNPEGIQKLFYYHSVNEPISIPLSEGSIEEYQIHSIGGQNYYPLIVGYEEAKIIKQEGLFYNIGDPIKNFFGKNVVIVGIMQRTDGAMDMAYLVPLTKEELS